MITFWRAAPEYTLRQITADEWVAHLTDAGYSAVATTPLLKVGQGLLPVVVSTCLTGLSAGRDAGPYGVFQTRIDGGLYGDYTRLWNSYQEAHDGHHLVVVSLLAGGDLP